MPPWPSAWQPGVEPSAIRRAVKEFRAVEHRLEYVATLRGVEYYNDSKATNVDATIKALESFPANIHLILGGKDKGSDYSELNPLLAERVKRVYTIGAAAAKIESQICNTVPVISAQTLESAVRKAADLAVEGDIVLLAPACASFDQFSSYEHRGQRVQRAGAIPGGLAIGFSHRGTLVGKRVSVDRWLFGVTMLMVFAGLVMVFSASAIVAKESFGSETEFLLKQVVYAVLGLAAMSA